MHRHGAVPEQVLGAFVSADGDHDADVRAKLDVRPRQRDRFAQRGHDPLHCLGDVDGRRQPVEEQAELVVAQARDRVLAADAGPQPVGHDRQRRFTGLVAEAVVEAVEALHVAVHDGHRGVVSFGLQQRVLHTVDEQRPVRQARERVVKGLVAQLGFQGVTLGDIARV